MSAKLEDLIARVEKAEGPDHEIDGDIAVAFGLFKPDEFWERGKGIYGDRWSMGVFVQYEAPHVTASIDAAVKLVEKVLPGWSWRTGKRLDTFCAAVATPMAGTFECRSAPSAPLALLTALLRSLPSPAQVEE